MTLPDDPDTLVRLLYLGVLLAGLLALSFNGGPLRIGRWLRDLAIWGLVAAMIITLTGWRWVDPIVAILIGLWVLPRTWILLRDTTHVLLEGAPRGLVLAEVRSAIVTALDEIGVTLGGEFPKPLTDDAVKAADVVVTMGCGDACPVFPGKRYLDWALDDPAGQDVAAVRPIRDEIERLVRGLLAEMGLSARA